MFARDAETEACGNRLNALLAAALAGTGLPIDRALTAKMLKFPAVTQNSMDTVADRDFIAESYILHVAGDDAPEPVLRGSGALVVG